LHLYHVDASHGLEHLAGMQWPPATPTIARLFRYPGCTAQCGRCAQSIKRIMDEPQRPANEHRSDSCPRGDWALSGNGHRPRSGRARRGPVSGSRVRRSNRVTWRTGVIAGRMMQRCRRGTVQPAGGPTGRLAFGTELRARFRTRNQGGTALRSSQSARVVFQIS
jgi:hypothetical protein